MTDTTNRRPLKSRGAGWAKAIASALGHADANPNLISAGSIAFAALGGALLMLAGGNENGIARAILFVGAGVCVQLRLLCNLIDGMVAVEYGRGSSSGPIWNELPDRIADVIFLASAGYAVSGGHIPFGAAAGWGAACLALLTAYIRELGRGLGFDADFSGPMAKPHRMAALTITCGVSALEPLWGWHGQSLMIGLCLIALGTAITAGRRTLTLARRLAARAAAAGDPD